MFDYHNRRLDVVGNAAIERWDAGALAVSHNARLGCANDHGPAGVDGGRRRGRSHRRGVAERSSRGEEQHGRRHTDRDRHRRWLPNRPIAPRHVDVVVTFEGFQPTTVHLVIGARPPAPLRVAMPLAGVTQEVNVSNAPTEVTTATAANRDALTADDKTLADLPHTRRINRRFCTQSDPQ